MVFSFLSLLFWWCSYGILVFVVFVVVTVMVL